MEPRVAAALGIDEVAREPVMRWISLLRAWNARIDLTAARTDDELHDLMLADAVFLASPGRIREGASVVDVGTGAGAPGLALALLRPDLKLTLVEPLTKRVAFLRTVLGTLGRTDVVLLRDRAENLNVPSPSRWDVAISRATLAPSVWIPLALDLAGSAFAFLAKGEAPAVADAAIEEDVSYAWPLTGAARRAVRYARHA